MLMRVVDEKRVLLRAAPPHCLADAFAIGSVTPVEVFGATERAGRSSASSVQDVKAWFDSATGACSTFLSLRRWGGDDASPLAEDDNSLNVAFMLQLADIIPLAFGAIGGRSLPGCVVFRLR